jgi:hypothetical protein
MHRPTQLTSDLAPARERLDIGHKVTWPLTRFPLHRGERKPFEEKDNVADSAGARTSLRPPS